MSNNKSNKELSRVPKYLGKNFTIVERNFDTLGSVVVDIMIFLANFKMKNLFGEMIFSLDDFCQVMGYNKTNLQRKLTPEQLKDLLGGISLPKVQVMNSKARDGEEKIKIHKLENTFEIALWRATKENVDYTYKDGDMTKYRAMQLLEGFDIMYDISTKKATKRMYSVKLASKVTKLLLSQYNLIELADYRNIPDRYGYKYFYLLIVKMIPVIKNNERKGDPKHYLMSVDELANIFGVYYQDKEGKPQNAAKKRRIKIVLDSIKSYIGVAKFDYKFVKNGGKYAYWVQFTFADNILEYFDERIKAVFYSDLFNACKSYFIRNKVVANKMTDKIRAFKDIFENEDNEDIFWDWFNGEDDREIKDQIYEEVYASVYKLSKEQF